MNQYVKEYKWSNIFRMLRNLRSRPEIWKEDFKERLVVISGATSGVGQAAAMKYASHGADIICINRNEEKSKELSETIKSTYGVECSYFIADFASLAEVRSVAMQLASMTRAIDVLIHNAGVYNATQQFSIDNLEVVFQTNYLSTFLLNYFLREKLKSQGFGRIIFVNSEAHRFAMWGLDLDDLNWKNQKYSGLKSYGASKTAQLLSMIILKEYFAGSGVTINAMHPGNVKTNSGQNNGKWYKITKKWFFDRGAIPITYSSEALYFLGASPTLANTTGKFFNLTTLEEPAPPSLDRVAAEKLWEKSLTLGELI